MSLVGGQQSKIGMDNTILHQLKLILRFYYQLIYKIILKMKNPQILLLISFMFFVSCSEKKIPIIIDNPTDKEVKLVFNGEYHFTIGQNNKITEEVPTGKIQLQVNDEPGIELIINPGVEYLLNPTKSNYYLEYLVYSISKDGLEKYYRDYGRKSSIVEGVEVQAEIEKIDGQVLIKRDWTYGLDEDISLRGQITNPANGSYVRVKKLYRANEILQNLMAN